MAILVLVILAVSGLLLTLLTKKHMLAALGLLVVLLVSMDASVLLNKGTPKSVLYEIFSKEVRTVAYYEFDEGNAIYMVLDGPRLYKLPWSEETAAQLQRAALKAREDGTKLKFRIRGFDPENERQFWAQPVREARPPKE